MREEEEDDNLAINFNQSRVSTVGIRSKREKKKKKTALVSGLHPRSWKRGEKRKAKGFWREVGLRWKNRPSNCLERDGKV